MTMTAAVLQMMNAYIFLLDFMEAVSTEMTGYVSKHQGSMRLLLEAAGRGEAALTTAIADNVQRLTDPGFLVYVPHRNIIATEPPLSTVQHSVAPSLQL